MSQKIGRNDTCWCGSGRKYKNCHLNRHREEPAPLNEQIQKGKTVFDKKYCLHPQATPEVCSGTIVKAHSIQKNGGLSRIARNGHVYGIAVDLATFQKNNGKPEPKLMGINKASTFTGFCSLHDNKVFEPIESASFHSNQEHAFLLSYRAICKDLFCRRAALDFVPYERTLDRGLSRDEQIQMQAMWDAWEIGSKYGVEKAEKLKATYDDALLRSDFSNVAYYIIYTNGIPDFLCLDEIVPDYDFQGNCVQDLFATYPNFETITSSVLVAQDRGAIVFSWLGKNNSGEKLAKSLHRVADSQKPQALTRLVFEYVENVFIAPHWWEKLNSTVKHRLLERFMSRAHYFEKPRNPNCLKDDGLCIASWSVEAVKTNLDLTSLT